MLFNARSSFGTSNVRGVTFPGPKMKYKIEWPYGLPVKKNRLAEQRMQAFLERYNIVCMVPITQGKENIESAPRPGMPTAWRLALPRPHSRTPRCCPSRETSLPVHAAKQTCSSRPRPGRAEPLSTRLTAQQAQLPARPAWAHPREVKQRAQ